ncbi:UNVERIFIED_CONTAM: hypothetical protein Sradi_0192200 [Sesamum radiatum]|uniref:Reverse transcriptase domain-containing protein n=1 Tax=Sesamum radiatum TaxID=300843 RepID=A0AAW2W0F8_SESRA
MEAIEEVKMIEFFENPSKIVKIGSLLDRQLEDTLVNFLKNCFDVFAWEVSEMRGISLEVMVHKLNINPEVRPVKQRNLAFLPLVWKETNNKGGRKIAPG